MIKLLTSVFFMLFVNLAGAQGIYVDGSSKGSDLTGDGTFDKPYKTITKAGTLAVAGNTIYIRGGTYRERAWIANSGAPGNPIVVTAYNNEEVIISGVDVISTPGSTAWVLTDHPSGKVWKTPMPSTRNIFGDSNHEAGRDQVFVDGIMQPEARWPNLPANVNPAIAMLDKSSYATAETGGLQGGNYADNALANVQYTNNGLPAANLSGAYIHFVPGARWSSATGKITGNSSNSLTFQYRYKAEDEAKEQKFYKPRKGDIFYLWGKYELLDAPGEWFRKEGMLYLYAPNGDSPNNHVVEIKSALEEREYAFQLFDNRSYITIKNIKLRACRIRTQDRTCTNIIIDEVDSKHAAHYSIVPQWYGSNGASAIGVSANSMVTNCTVAYNVEGGIVMGDSGSKATNNVVHDTGYIGNAGTSLSCSGANMELKNNTVWGVGSANAIDFRDSSNSRIMYNDAAESGKITFDGGIFMCARDFDGLNTEVAYNYAHDGKGLTGGDFYGTSGFYFEGNTQNYKIHHNVMWNTGVGINIPNDSDEYFNYNKNFKIYNNTAYNTPFVMRSNDMTGTELKNNIFSSFAGKFNSIPTENNLLTEPGLNYGNQIASSNIYSTNPQYTDAANRNFVPLPSSPLVNAGQILPPYTNGFLGTAPDIGAFESGKPAFIAGALVRPQDVANITVTYDNAAFPNKKFTVSGLPAGRKIGADFKLKIGNAPSGGIMQYNYATNQVSFTNVPNGNLTGVQPISLDMGTEVRATSSTIDLSNLSVYSIAVYPNPSRGDFFIRIPQEHQDKEVKIRVYALDGKLILDKTFDQDKAEGIKLTAKGIYILKTTIEDQIFTNKIFVN